MKSKFKKSAKATAVAIAVGVMLLAGVAPALAARDHVDKPNLIDKIAHSFGLKRDDVQKLVEQHREEHQQDRRAKLEERLSQAVKDGKLTDVQKATILQKADELKSFADSLKDKSPEDRRAAIKAQHLALVQWARDNNIPAPFDRMFIMGPKPMHKGMHGHMSQQ